MCSVYCKCTLQAVKRKLELMNGKKIVPVFLIIIGIAVVVPFNYIYDIEAPEVDLIWVVVGIAMIGFGIYSLKKRKK